METILLLITALVLPIWLVSLSIRAGASDKPETFDPLDKINGVFRRVKVVLKYNWIPLTAILLSGAILIFAFKNITQSLLPYRESIIIICVITLNVASSWLIGKIFFNRALWHLIRITEREGLTERKGHTNPNESDISPYLDTKAHNK